MTSESLGVVAPTGKRLNAKSARQEEMTTGATNKVGEK